ncbi:MAG TPA: PrgI family protein [Mycobacteriales bacterium]|nr:PrgI family protein [Mycobacteriales bacterium]
MTSPRRSDRVRIPADIDRPDPLLAGLAARPLAILAGTGLLLCLAYAATRRVLPLPVFAGLAAPLVLSAAVLALGRRDGLSADRLALAALRLHLGPRQLVPVTAAIRSAPGWVGPAGPLPGPLRLPATAISGDGTIELAGDGAALVCRASSVTFALRTPAEQQGLLAAFARYLNAATSPVQFLIRNHPVDLTADIAALLDAAAGLPHPALEAAAREHAAFLTELTGGGGVLARELLVVFRDPVPADAAVRLHRCAADAAVLLAAAGVTLSVLDGPTAAWMLARCADPNTDPPPIGVGAGTGIVTGRLA